MLRSAQNFAVGAHPRTALLADHLSCSARTLGAACARILARPSHSFRPHQPIEVGGRDVAEPQRLFAQRRAVGVRGLRDRRRAFVADRRRERRDEHQRPFHQLADARLVGANADDAVVGEGARRVREQSDRLEHRCDDHRLVDVELEMALAGGGRDRGVVAEYLAADHGQRLRLRRVHLARHDRRAGLVLRQDQFAEAGARP